VKLCLLWNRHGLDTSSVLHSFLCFLLYNGSQIVWWRGRLRETGDLTDSRREAVHPFRGRRASNWPQIRSRCIGRSKIGERGGMSGGITRFPRGSGMGSSNNHSGKHVTESSAKSHITDLSSSCSLALWQHCRFSSCTIFLF
jgi:hypothetical protein